MIHKTALVPLWAVVASVFVALSVVQYTVPSYHFTIFSVGAVAFAFTFKTWVNFVSAYTMYRQHGTSKLARACQRYFWAMLSMSVAFALLFWLATADGAHLSIPGAEIREVRNTLRNVAITAIVAVILTGAQMMDALFAYLRDQSLTKRQPPDGLG